jgi:hypothetical protein
MAMRRLPGASLMTPAFFLNHFTAMERLARYKKKTLL